MNMLYFMKAGPGRIKIGSSGNVLNRLKQHQTSNPDTCEIILAMYLENARDVEQLLGERLSYCKCREKGEWFNISFSSAFEELCKIRNFLNMGDDKELSLESPQKPSLDECRTEFEKWVRTIYWTDQEWDQNEFPLEFFWNQFRNDFLDNPKAKPIDNISERFDSIRRSVSTASAKKS